MSGHDPETLEILAGLYRDAVSETIKLLCTVLEQCPETMTARELGERLEGSLPDMQAQLVARFDQQLARLKDVAA